MDSNRRTAPVDRVHTALVACLAIGVVRAVADIAALVRVHDRGPELTRAAVATGSVDVTRPVWFLSELRGILHLSLLSSGLSVVLLCAGVLVVRRRSQLVRYGIQAGAVAMVVLALVAIAGDPETILSDDSLPRAVQDAMTRLLPGWYATENSLCTLVQTVGLVIVVVLLMRSGVGDHYRPSAGPVEPDLATILAARAERLSAAPADPPVPASEPAGESTGVAISVLAPAGEECTQDQDAGDDVTRDAERVAVACQDAAGQLHRDEPAPDA